MNLRIGTHAGYNNSILIATSDLSLGPNQDTNLTPLVDSQLPSIDDQPPVSLPSDTVLNNALLDDDTDQLDDEEIDDTSIDDVHQEENNSLILRITVMGGLGVLIYELVFR